MGPGDPIILVHGAWGNAHNWDHVATHLRAHGREVIAIDLPSHGDDPTDPGKVHLADYAHKIAATLDANGPALLVGHSMGGMAISAAAEIAPANLRKLVYVTAFLPCDDQSLIGLIATQNGPGISEFVRPGPVKGTTILEADGAVRLLCQDASPAQQAAFAEQLGPQPNRPQTDRVRLSDTTFGTIPRAYVFCTGDRVITPKLQRQMVQASPCAQTFTLDCGHMPQITRPKELAEILTAL